MKIVRNKLLRITESRWAQANKQINEKRDIFELYLSFVFGGTEFHLKFKLPGSLTDLWIARGNQSLSFKRTYVVRRAKSERKLPYFVKMSKEWDICR